jgi:hypothetical protein
MDAKRIQSLIPQLYALAAELEAAAPGRRFTPDGHMVGSIGEVIAACQYGLELAAASTEGYDAIHKPSGIKVEIKATQGRLVAMRCQPPHLLVLLIHADGSAETVFNGPGKLAWDAASQTSSRNGQSTISLSRLRELQESVPESERLSPCQ